MSTVVTSLTKASSIPSVAPQISPEEMEQINRQAKALAKIFEEWTTKAKYKIELFFHHARSGRRPCVGLVTIWASGAQLHGGGDSRLCSCPGKKLGKNSCEAVLPETSYGGDAIFCPACNTLWKAHEVIEHYLYNLPMQHWATVLVYHYARCGQNADITIKYSQNALIEATQLETEKQRMGEVLDPLRQRRMNNGAVYPLKNIIKDVSNGADLYTRFRQFLEA